MTDAAYSDDATIAAAEAADRKRRSRRRRRRRALVAVALAPPAVALALLAVVRTPLLRLIVEPRLERAFGLELSSASMVVDWDGGVVATGVSVRAPGVAGPAGEVLAAERIEATLDWGAALGRLLGGGELPVTAVRLERPVVRLSRSVEDGSFNIAPLLKGGGGGAPPERLPLINIADGALALGEHRAGAFEPLMHMQVGGRLGASDASKPIYEIALVQLNAPGDKAMRLIGSVDLTRGGGRLEVSDIDLSQWRFDAPTRESGALLRQFAIEGAITDATFEYEQATGVAMSLDLRSVNLTIPVPVEPDPETGRSERLMRMTSVDGVIRVDAAGLHASLAGLVEDFPARVRLDTEGVGLDSAVRCVISTDRFVVSEDARLFPFMPRQAHEQFADFSRPTMAAWGEVVFARGAPGPEGAAPFTVEGTIDFENGVAAHKEFPYQATELRGRVRFDRERVEIVRITGVGPTGARIFADGWIEIGRKEPGEILITVLDVPIDEHLIAAMPERYREVAEAVCNTTEHDALVRAGLVQSSTRKAELDGRAAELRTEIERVRGGGGAVSARIALERELAAVEDEARRPAFDLGGRANVDIALRRKKGERFLVEVNAEVERLGLVPKWFAYPGTARDVRIQINRERVLAKSAMLTAPTGAMGSLDVAVRTARATGGKPDPRVDIELGAVPIDGLLLSALRRGNTELSAGDVLERLGVRGLIDRVTASVASKPDASVGYSVFASFAGVEAGPAGAAPFDGSLRALRRGGEGRGMVSGLTGSLRLTDEQLSLGPIVGAVGDGALELRIESAPGEPRDLEATLEMLDLDLSTPIESLVHGVSPALASRIAELRRRTRMAGLLDGTARIAISPEGEVSSRAELSRARGVAFDVPGGRASINATDGLAVVGPGEVFFDAVRCQFDLDGAPAGVVALDGRLALAGEERTDMRMSVTGGRFEARPLREAVALGAARGIAEWWTAAAPRGVFDAQIHLSGLYGESPALRGMAAPRSLSLSVDGVDIMAETMSGRVAFGPEGGQIEQLAAAGEGWSLSADGAWTTGAEGEFAAAVAMRAGALTPQITALLPREVRAAFDEIDLRIPGGFTLRDATIVYGAQTGTGFDGVVDFEGAELDAGFEIRELAGAARIRAGAGAAGGSARVDVEIAAESLRAAGMRMTNGRAHLYTDPEGALVLPGFFADIYGGRIAGSFAVFPAREGAIAYAYVDEGELGASAGPRSRYQADVRFAGVDMAQVFADLATGAESLRPGHDEAPARMNAELSIAGALGDRDSTRGRGLVSIEEGRIVRLPLLIPVLELSSLQPPMGEGLDVAEAEFYIDGGRAVFERLVARSASIAVVGEGEATWPGLELNLRFKTSGNLRLPLLSDLIDAIRNELVTITVTGTLEKPEFGSVQLPTTSRFLRGVFRSEPPRRGGQAAPPRRVPE